MVFARAADDWHWAHDDVGRASRGPFGGTIAHAHLTLSLIPHLFASLVGFADQALFSALPRESAGLSSSEVRRFRPIRTCAWP
jgi:acyl dehydratase